MAEYYREIEPYAATASQSEGRQEMRWKKAGKTEWHKVFAWWPVTTVCNNVVWLEYVEYMRGEIGPDEDGFAMVQIRPNQYRLLSTSGGI